MSRATREFVPLSDAAVRAVAGPNSRHAALIEDAFHVLVETPGGGRARWPATRGRAAAAKRAVQSIAARADDGLEVSEADIRVAARIGEAGEAGVAAGGAAAGRQARRHRRQDRRPGPLPRHAGQS